MPPARPPRSSARRRCGPAGRCVTNHRYAKRAGSVAEGREDGGRSAVCRCRKPLRTLRRYRTRHHQLSQRRTRRSRRLPDGDGGTRRRSGLAPDVGRAVPEGCGALRKSTRIQQGRQRLPARGAARARRRDVREGRCLRGRGEDLRLARQPPEGDPALRAFRKYREGRRDEGQGLRRKTGGGGRSRARSLDGSRVGPVPRLEAGRRRGRELSPRGSRAGSREVLRKLPGGHRLQRPRGGRRRQECGAQGGGDVPRREGLPQGGADLREPRGLFQRREDVRARRRPLHGGGDVRPRR